MGGGAKVPITSGVEGQSSSSGGMELMVEGTGGSSSGGIGDSLVGLVRIVG